MNIRNMTMVNMIITMVLDIIIQMVNMAFITWNMDINMIIMVNMDIMVIMKITVFMMNTVNMDLMVNTVNMDITDTMICITITLYQQLLICLLFLLITKVWKK